MRQQNKLRWSLIVVELGDERFEHLRHRDALVGAREIGPVAPVIAGAEEEHLNADLAAILMDGEDVCFLDALRIDALMTLDVAECSQPVAVDSGPFKIQVFGGILHLRRNLGLHLLAAARQEILRLRNKLGIVGSRDFTCAGS